MRTHPILVLAALGLPLPAQTVVATVFEQTAGQLRVEHLGAAPGDLRTIPALADLSAGLALQAQSGVAQGSFVLQVAQGSVPTLDARVACSADASTSGNAASLLSSADLALYLTSTAPAAGVVAVEIELQPSGGAPGFGNFTVDVDADGVVDLAGNPYGAPPFAVYGEFWRGFAYQLPIRVRHTGSLVVPAWQIGEYSAHVRIRWFPDTGVATEYGSGCGLELSARRSATGDLRFATAPAQGPDGCLLFGFQAANTPCVLPPYCPLLTSGDTWSWWSSGMLTVACAPLPIGCTMFAQAATFVSPAQTLLSNGVRFHVGP